MITKENRISILLNNKDTGAYGSKKGKKESR
jgi:hypothetical protein